MTGSICDNCKNKITYKVYFTSESRLSGHKCVFGIEERLDITECSHFEEKPKDYSEQSKKSQDSSLEGKYPRNQPDVELDTLLCARCQMKIKAVYVHKEWYRHGLCQGCYDLSQSELVLKKVDYKLIKQPEKKDGPGSFTSG